MRLQVFIKRFRQTVAQNDKDNAGFQAYAVTLPFFEAVLFFDGKFDFVLHFFFRCLVFLFKKKKRDEARKKNAVFVSAVLVDDGGWYEPLSNAQDTGIITQGKCQFIR